MNDNCVFCKIINNDIPSETVFEDDEFKVILDKFPASKGHILIIPKNHIENIFDIDEELAGRVFKLAVKISNSIKNTLGVDNLNIVQNNGSIAGQTVFHFHMHIIPRYENDNINIKWETKSFSNECMEKIRKLISQNVYNTDV